MGNASETSRRRHSVGSNYPKHILLMEKGRDSRSARSTKEQKGMVMVMVMVEEEEREKDEEESAHGGEKSLSNSV